MKQITKDPNESVDWWLCYADPSMDSRLGDDTIASISSIALEPTDEITVLSSGINASELIDDVGATQPVGTVIAVWLYGGTAGRSYEMTVTFTTEGGRTYDDTILIRCLNE